VVEREPLSETNEVLWHIFAINWAFEMCAANQNIGKTSFKIYPPRRNKIFLRHQHLA